MSTLSITLPDDLARSSEAVARELGVSQSELIRRGLSRELECIQAEWQRQAMADAFLAMKKDRTYRQEAEALDRNLDEVVGNERDSWWTG